MYLKIKVVTDSRKEVVKKVKEDEYAIWLKEPAAQNAANTRIIEICKTLFPNKIVRIINGHHHTSKLISIN